MDVHELPEEIRKFKSPNGRFELVIQTFDRWKTREPVAILWKTGKQEWRLTLPHSHGPRYALVSDTGVSILFDEWINIASNHAVTVISKDGMPMRDWSFETVQTTLEASPDQLNEHAGSGLWISKEPTIDGEIANVPSGGVSLDVDIRRLTLTRNSDLELS